MKHFVFAAAVLSATAAQADGLYYGAGLSLATAESNDRFGATYTSEDSYAAIGVTAGYRWDSPSVFYGAEFDADISLNSEFEVNGVPCSGGAEGPYYCENIATVRLRAIVGAPIGGMEGFASFGVAAMTGVAATNTLTTGDATNSGYTVGAGLQHDMNGNTLRYELIYDNLDTNTKSQGSGYAPAYEAISLKASYLFN
jgi:opacity protein-like surface antigen